MYINVYKFKILFSFVCVCGLLGVVNAIDDSMRFCFFRLPYIQNETRIYENIYRRSKLVGSFAWFFFFFFKLDYDEMKTFIFEEQKGKYLARLIINYFCLFCIHFSFLTFSHSTPLNSSISFCFNL